MERSSYQSQTVVAKKISGNEIPINETIPDSIDELSVFKYQLRQNLIATMKTIEYNILCSIL